MLQHDTNMQGDYFLTSKYILQYLFSQQILKNTLSSHYCNKKIDSTEEECNYIFLLSMICTSSLP